MSRNSKIKRDKKKKKGPSPGDRPRKASQEFSSGEEAIAFSRDAIKEPIKPQTGRNDVPSHPPIERRGRRGG